VADIVTDRLTHGLAMFRERFGAPAALVAGGGVAANAAIRKALGRVAQEAGTPLVVPAPALCTDNGAMIAWAGAERLALGLTDMLDAEPHARWLLRDVKGPLISEPAAAGSEFPNTSEHKTSEHKTSEPPKRPEAKGSQSPKASGKAQPP
jgi:hypothetical protein